MDRVTPRIERILVGEGLLDAAQVAVARTCREPFALAVLQLGFIDEETLAHTLSRRLELPLVTAVALQTIDQACWRLLPAQIARREYAVAVRADDQRLFLAMVDPTNYELVVSLATATGRVVQRGVACLSTIRAVLDRLEHAAGAVDDDRVARREVTTAELGPPDPDPDLDPDPIEQTLRLKRDTLRGVAPATREPEGAATAEDAGHHALHSMRGYCSRRLILKCLGGRAVGWLGKGCGLDLATVHALSLPIDGSVIGEVIASRAAYLGPWLADDPSERAFVEALGGIHTDVVLVPVLQQGRVIGVLFGDELTLEPSLPYLQEVAEGLALWL